MTMLKSIFVGIGTSVAIIAYIATFIVAGNVAYAITDGNESIVGLAVLAAILIPLIGVLAGITHYNKND